MIISRMKSLLKTILILLIISPFVSLAQTKDSDKTTFEQCIPKPDVIDGQTVYTILEAMPQYPGGDLEMMKFVHQHINFPGINIDDGIPPSTTYVTFVIDSTGQIRNSCILRRQNKEYLTPLEKEALRVVNMMPKNWTPGKKNGKVVAARFNLPIRICLK